MKHDDRRNAKRKRSGKRVLQARSRFCKFPISMHRLAYRYQRFLTIFFSGILREDTRRMENERSSRYEILLIKPRTCGVIFHAKNKKAARTMENESTVQNRQQFPRGRSPSVLRRRYESDKSGNGGTRSTVPGKLFRA